MTFLSGPLPRIIAHRGLAVGAPENTLLAFLRALNAGATHLETDVHASADGVAVISHDPDLSRVAGRAVRVGQLTMPELRRIQLGDGQSYCSLADALDAFPDARFNIDIKDLASAAPAAAAILKARATDRVLITSFDEKRRRAAVDALPGVASSASVSRVLPAIAAAKAGSTSAVRRALRGLVAVQIPERQGPLRLVSRRTVRILHDAGVEVHVWTVNDPADMTRLLDLGVDGLVTDRCDTLKALVDARI
ncbi:glycerophosphodiester phosphodiesterase family protein [Leifsonia sp. Le1]|uniref:glycerophosphodiester phosphodiesterase family protein n=1 Tax=Leifsonia sp. Le1 TaxID=3404918 RepID=UPI003EBAC1A6